RWIAGSGHRHANSHHATDYGPAVAQAWQALFTPAIRGRSPLDQFLYLDSQTRLVDFLNFEVDRMSMAHSVEARVPFLDHRLWEFCARLPPALKLSRRRLAAGAEKA